jgi:hypothetical protein
MSTPRRASVFIVRSSVRSDEREEEVRPAALSDGGDRARFPWHPDENDPRNPISVNIRSVRIYDVMAIARVSTTLPLLQPELGLSGYRAMGAAVAAVKPWLRNRPQFLVATASGSLIAFAQWQPIAPDKRWELVALGSATGVYDALPILEEVVRQSVVTAGLKGVKRLYARIPVGSEIAEAFERTDFAPYASETIFVGENLSGSRRPILLREQEQTDTWAIHQLYNAAVPKQVQFAEAHTSHRWDLRARVLHQKQRARGWLLEEGHHLLAYARVTSQGNIHVLELIYDPAHHQRVPDLIDGVLARIRGGGRIERVFCALRGYQAEAVGPLCENGFDPLLEQDLYVKYTTATARLPQTEAVPFHAEVIDRLPKRVPSFLHGKPGDGPMGS